MGQPLGVYLWEPLVELVISLLIKPMSDAEWLYRWIFSFNSRSSYECSPCANRTFAEMSNASQNVSVGELLWSI